MPATKYRGKSAISNQNDSINSNNNSIPKSSTSLLKIESVVPTLTNRLNSTTPTTTTTSTTSLTTTNKKFIRRSNSTLSNNNSGFIKNRIINNKLNINTQISGLHDDDDCGTANGSSSSSLTSTHLNNGGSSNLKIKRTIKEKEKFPDRINLDRRGLTSIPFIEDENHLRLLSLQHNLINVFHIPTNESKDSNGIIVSSSSVNQVPPSSNQLKKTISSAVTANPTNRNILPTSENKIQLNVNTKIGMLRKSNSFINGITTSSLSTALNQKINFEQRTTKGKLSHMMSLTSSTDLLQQQQHNNIQQQNQKPNVCHLPSPPPYTLPGFCLSLQNLVFLDLYDNQIDRISNLDGLKSLTVLLLGKNRITDITGIISVKMTLRVLDLHGNKISNITQKICQLQELKSLNLAGNALRQINGNDFQGMFSLKELNLKRNRIKKLNGFDDLRNLERLWLCHNDIQKIDDMSCIGKAINLREVTIENNPISLGGDCVSFLVSYLPNLLLLSQMQVTEQVKRAAMAWRKSKEISDLNYQNISIDACHVIRREEVISNARTSWELLRSQQIKSNHHNHNHQKNDSEIFSNLSESILLSKKVISNNSKQKNVITKDKKLPRPSSQENHDGTINDQDTNDIVAGEDFFRLPPILAPFLEKTFSQDKSNSQGSSLGPNVDSASSNCSSDTEDKLNEIVENQPNELIEIEKVEIQLEIESTQLITQQTKEIDQSTTPITSPDHQNDRNSNLSTKSINSDSSSTTTTTTTPNSEEPRSTKIRSANPNRRFITNSANSNSIRAQTARGYGITQQTESRYQQSNNTQATPSIGATTTTNGPNNQNQSTKKSSTSTSSSNLTDREREQGGDYLIEICGRYLNVYGLGALKFIDKQWNTQKANDVHTIKFSYINFNNIATILYRIKVRFPNAENFIFRETNITCLGQLNALAEIQGINSLIIETDGNPICTKDWRNYAIYRLSHWGLKQLNNIDVTEDEIQIAEQMYIGLSDLVVWSLPDTLLQPLLTRLRLEENCVASKLTAKEWLLKADPSLKCVVGKEALQWKKSNSLQDELNSRQKGRNHLTVMMENTCNAVEKLQKLEVLWGNMLTEMVRNTLLDYSQIDAYVKNLMEDILK